MFTSCVKDSVSTFGKGFHKGIIVVNKGNARCESLAPSKRCSSISKINKVKSEFIVDFQLCCNITDSVISLYVTI